MIYIAGIFVSIIANAENRIAVVDTGINVNEKNKPYLCKDGHEDFTGYGLYDAEGHGTEVVQYIIDNSNTKNFCVVVFKFWERGLSTQQTISNTVSAFRKAKELKIKLINYSANGNTRTEEEDLFIKNNPEITFVVAAGNDNVNLDISPRYPASYGYNNVFVVGALAPDGKKHKVSNYGSVVSFWEKSYATSFATAIKTGKIVRQRFAR